MEDISNNITLDLSNNIANVLKVEYEREQREREKYEREKYEREQYEREQYKQYGGGDYDSQLCYLIAPIDDEGNMIRGGRKKR